LSTKSIKNLILLDSLRLLREILHLQIFIPNTLLILILKKIALQPEHKDISNKIRQQPNPGNTYQHNQTNIIIGKQTTCQTSNLNKIRQIIAKSNNNTQ
jgi:hypothetical protein